MAIDVVAFSTEGHRLLMACPLSPADIARKADVPRQRVSQWRTGRSRPSGEAREALERAIGISATSWDAPPVAQPGGPKTVPPSPPVVDDAPVDLGALDSAPSAELEDLGLAGLEGVVSRLRELAPSLPPRERVQAIAAEGRIHTTIVNIRAKEADARREYLDSEDFRQDVRLLVAAFPSSAAMVRSVLGRLGVELPPPATQAASVVHAAPRTADDVERLIGEHSLPQTGA
jgi:transcriptional regulator with XRE-family HTH domain